MALASQYIVNRNRCLEKQVVVGDGGRSSKRAGRFYVIFFIGTKVGVDPTVGHMETTTAEGLGL